MNDNPLLKKLKDLQILSGFFFKVPEDTVRPPKNLKAVEEKLEREGSQVNANIPLDISLDKIAVIAQRRSEGENSEYSHREGKYLPFALQLLPRTPQIIDSVGNDLYELMDSRLVFKRTVYEYFELSDSADFSRKLRKIIKKTLQKHPDFYNSVMYLQKNPHLIEENGANELGTHFANGVDSSLSSSLFPANLWTCKFIKDAIISFFNNKSISLDALTNAAEKYARKRDYDSIVPFIADNLIMRVSSDGNQSYIDFLIKYLTRVMGDPRDGSRNFHWRPVSEEAIKIYLHWRKKGDLSLFFNLVGLVIKDSDSRRRWKWREKFWGDFIDNMDNTRVILNDQAIILAKNNLQNDLGGYGRLQDGGKSKCLLTFSIGEYVFVEASDVGTLRIYYKEGPIPFFDQPGAPNRYSYQDIAQGRTKVPSFEEIRHMSSESLHWQYQAYRFMRKYCHIGFKYPENWRP
jgi:hypothetical protein